MNGLFVPIPTDGATNKAKKKLQKILIEPKLSLWIILG
jgi:hypothetical protein